MGAKLTASFSGEEERRYPRISSSSASSRDFQERGGSPQTLKNDVPSNIYTVDMEFVTHHQPNEYIWPKFLTLINASIN